ncbi:MAG: helix-turn-helix domain-containing protein [Saprospiraceae bacterium]|nr:helix-turn-helix domain-containing protein [Saprospiraceae bacterium]
MQKLAKNLRFLRRRRNVSQSKFAAEIGLTRSNIASYELGKAEPSASNLAKIARYFNINMLQLIEADLEAIGAYEDASAMPFGSNVKKDLSKLLSEQAETLRKLRGNATELDQIIQGLKGFFRMRMASFDEVTPEMQSLANDFENLMSVNQELINLNNRLMAYIEGVDASETPK